MEQSVKRKIYTLLSVYRWRIKWKLFTSFYSYISGFSNYAIFCHKSLLLAAVAVAVAVARIKSFPSSELQNNNNNNEHDYCYHFTFSYLLAKGHNLTDNMETGGMSFQLLWSNGSVHLLTRIHRLLLFHSYVCSLVDPYIHFRNGNEKCALTSLLTMVKRRRNNKMNHQTHGNMKICAEMNDMKSNCSRSKNDSLLCHFTFPMFDYRYALFNQWQHCI